MEFVAKIVVIVLVKPTGQAISVISVQMGGMTQTVSHSAVLDVAMCVIKTLGIVPASLDGTGTTVTTDAATDV